ncbi:4337_t:CDS:2 [Paraglomus brasilianum]|uniref:4337_t:CDS:1 n=1 Tax=Paraglomus brasilianum TaxID=144538 RepID=A0A9N9C9I4_9GLOM|nr:4337_t:CDS:2 [Paraglomus brasilianum]
MNHPIFLSPSPKVTILLMGTYKSNESISEKRGVCIIWRRITHSHTYYGGVELRELNYRLSGNTNLTFKIQQFISTKPSAVVAIAVATTTYVAGRSRMKYSKSFYPFTYKISHSLHHREWSQGDLVSDTAASIWFRTPRPAFSLNAQHSAPALARCSLPSITLS